MRHSVRLKDFFQHNFFLPGLFLVDKQRSLTTTAMFPSEDITSAGDKQTVRLLAKKVAEAMLGPELLTSKKPEPPET